MRALRTCFSPVLYRQLSGIQKKRWKKSGLDSPGDGDALALTFAWPVLPIEEPSDDEDDLNDGWFYRPAVWVR
jgi:hypothetical protein